MRRTIGAILIETRPERISRSAWRGEARKASKPKRAMSTRAPTIDIISIAQQARPKVAGKMRVAARPVERLVERRGEDALLDVLLELVALEVAAQHVARAQLADAEVLGGGRPARGGLPPFERSPSPHVDERDQQQAMKTTVSISAKVPKARSCTAIG